MGEYIELSDAFINSDKKETCTGNECIVLSYTQNDTAGIATIPVSYFNTNKDSGSTIDIDLISKYTLWNTLISQVGAFGSPNGVLLTKISNLKPNVFSSCYDYKSAASTIIVPIFENKAYNGNWTITPDDTYGDYSDRMKYVLSKYAENGTIMLTNYYNMSLLAAPINLTDSIPEYINTFISDSYFGVVSGWKIGSDISKKDICYTIRTTSFDDLYGCDEKVKKNTIDITLTFNTSGLYISYTNGTAKSSIITTKYM